MIRFQKQVFGDAEFAILREECGRLEPSKKSAPWEEHQFTREDGVSGNLQATIENVLEYYAENFAGCADQFGISGERGVNFEYVLDASDDELALRTRLTPSDPKKGGSISYSAYVYRMDGDSYLFFGPQD